jgi:predicted ester cyclase
MVAIMTPVLERLLDLWRRPVVAGPDAEAAFREVYADPVTVNGAPMSVADLVQRARMLQDAFTDLRMEVVHDYELPNRIVVAFFMHGRHTGPFVTAVGTLAPTGKPVTQRVTDILTLTDGRISDIWVIADELGVLQQLGTVRLA